MIHIQNHGFDHVEFILNDIRPQAAIYERMGFERVGKRTQADKGLTTDVYQQGYVRIYLTEALKDVPAADATEQVQFLKAQAEGVCVLGLDVTDAEAAYHHALSKGARSAMAPKTFTSSLGSVTRAEIWTPGRVRYAFLTRSAKADQKTQAFYDEDLVIDRMESPSPYGIRVIDHLTNNVDIGEIKKWVDFYQSVFDFEIIRHFEISTGRTGLISDAVQSRDGRVTVPVNEATEPESQVQEFVNRMRGPGVQHLALLTTDIVHSLKSLKPKGFKFLNVPSTYYDMVPKRVPHLEENLSLLQDLQILVDSEGPGYLLQLFTEEILGPFFFEIIQRKGGNKGFGEGNFRALFEAIERDQVKRGVLKG